MLKLSIIAMERGLNKTAKTYILNHLLFAKYMLRDGDAPKCKTCGKDLKVGDEVFTVRGWHGKISLRCRDCAQRLNMTD